MARMDLGEAAEAIAAEASEGSGLDDRPRADPSVLAVAYLGLRLVPSSRLHACLIEDRVYYPARASERDASYWIAHEVGHYLAREAKTPLTFDEEEIVASRIGCALILPRRAFLRDVRDGVRVVADLVALWPLATPRIVRRRLVELDALLVC
jgi:hypothetical protein